LGTFIVNDALPPAFTLEGLKLHEEPDGMPEQVNDTEPLNPPMEFTAIVADPEVR
jgi:hypothetical protein